VRYTAEYYLVLDESARPPEVLRRAQSCRGVGYSTNVSWQEKNIAVGLAALFVLIVMAHLTFGSEPSGAEAPAAEPVATAPVAQSPAHEPLKAPALGREGR
jgi:hypothetical protein